MRASLGRTREHPTREAERRSGSSRHVAVLCGALAALCAGRASPVDAQEVPLPPPPVVTSEDGLGVGDDGDAIVIVAPERGSVYDEPVYHEHETFLKNVPLQRQITIDEAMDVPGIMGDPVKAIAYLPGVVSTGFGLFVHGSKDGESAATINHLPIGYLFHMGGLHSVMSPEAIDQFDAYLGGFDATYGNAIGGVLDVTPRYPVGAGTGYVHIGALDSSAGFDVALSDRTAFSLHARRSYIDLLIPVDEFSDEESNVTIEEFPNYYDVNAILHYRNGDHRVSFEMLLARDGFGIDTQENEVTDPAATGEVSGTFGFSTAGLRWRYDDGLYRANTLLGYMYNEQRMQMFSNFSIDTNSHLGTLYHVSTYKLGRHDVAAGCEVGHFHMPLDATLPLLPDADEVDPDITSAPVFNLRETLDLTSYSVFAQDTISLGDRLRLRLGVRLEDSNFGEYELRGMPRSAMVFDATPHDTLSVSAGRYSTLPAGHKLLDQIGNPGLVDEKSSQYSMSWTHRSEKWGTMTLEPYYKTLDNLALSAPTDNYRNDGYGFSYGASLSTKLRREKWYLDASYYWQEAERQLTTDDPKMYDFYGDVTHTLQAGVSFQINQKWSAGFLAKYATGQPYTPVIGTYDYVDTDGSTRVRPIHGDPYSERLPPFFTLNVRAASKSVRENGRTVEWALEIINVTNYTNITGIEYDDDYNEVGKRAGLPLLPSVNMTYRW